MKKRRRRPKMAKTTASIMTSVWWSLGSEDAVPAVEEAADVDEVALKEVEDGDVEKELELVVVTLGVAVSCAESEDRSEETSILVEV